MIETCCLKQKRKEENDGRGKKSLFQFKKNLNRK